MAAYEAAILDVDGTIVRGEHCIPGAIDGIEALEDAGVSVLLFSNNPTRRPEYYRSKLARFGIEIDEDSILTSASVSASALTARHPDGPLFVVGEDRLRTILEQAGLTLTNDPERADAVLVSIDRDLSFSTLEASLLALEREVPFYATDPDVTIPTEDGVMPGTGTILAALETASGRTANSVFGKPSSIAAEMALERLESDPASTLVVGDRIDTDLELGRRIGSTTVGVTTGIATRETLEAGAGGSSPSDPDYVLDTLLDLEGILGDR